MRLRSSHVYAMLGRGLRWWTGELCAMVPARIRSRPETGPRAEIRLSPKRVEIVHTVQGKGRRLVEERPLEELDPESWRQMASLLAGARSRIVLGPPDCFVTQIGLPPAARKRLRSAVALQLSQTSPIDPALIHWAMHPVAAAPGQLLVRVAMARSSRIEQIRSLFATNDLAAPPFHVETPETTVRIASGHDGCRRKRNNQTRRLWLLAVCMVATIPFTIPIGATILSAHYEDEASAVEQMIAPKVMAERRAREAEELRRALKPVFGPPNASATIEELAARLPQNAHLRTLRQNADRGVEFTVETESPDEVGVALEGSPLLPGLLVIDQVEGTGGNLATIFRTGQR